MSAPRDNFGSTSGSYPRVTRENQGLDTPREDQSGETQSELARWTELAKHDTLNAAYQVQRAITRSRKEYDDELKRGLVQAVVIAGILYDSPNKWLQFIGDRFWARPGHKPKADGAREALKWVMQFVFDARDSRAKARANEYRGALQKQFDEEVDPETILDYLQRNSIDWLYRANLPGKKIQDDGQSDPLEECEDLPSTSSAGQTGLPRPQSRALVIVNADQKLPAVIESGRSSQPAVASVGQANRKAERSSGRLTLAKRARLIENSGRRAVLIAMCQTDLDLLLNRYGDDRRAVLNCFVKAGHDWVDLDCIGLADTR